jgi:hypothetical protein
MAKRRQYNWVAMRLYMPEGINPEKLKMELLIWLGKQKSTQFGRKFLKGSVVEIAVRKSI